MPVLFISGLNVPDRLYPLPSGSDRQVLFFVTGEQNGFTDVPTGVTYGGVAMTLVHSDGLPGNQLWEFVYRINEASLASVVGTEFIITWPGSSPIVPAIYACTLGGVNQSTPIDTVQINSSTFGSTTPGTVNCGDGGHIVEFVAGGSGGATFTWVNYTERQAYPLSGFSASVASRDVVTGGSIAEEYSASAANRSFLLSISFNEVSTKPSISDIDSDNVIELGQQNVIVAGTNFEPAQGTGSIVLSPTTNIADARAVTISSVDSWSNTSIQFDIDPTSNLKYGTLYLFIISDSVGTSNAFTISIIPQSTKNTKSIEGISTVGIYKSTNGIQLGSDIVEYDNVSSQGGSVNVLLSGIAEITYGSEPPGADSFTFRIFCDLDYLWSNSAIASFDDATASGIVNYTTEDDTLNSSVTITNNASLEVALEDNSSTIVASVTNSGNINSSIDSVLSSIQIGISNDSNILSSLDNISSLINLNYAVDSLISSSVGDISSSIIFNQTINSSVLGIVSDISSSFNTDINIDSILNASIDNVTSIISQDGTVTGSISSSIESLSSIINSTVNIDSSINSSLNDLTSVILGDGSTVTGNILSSVDSIDASLLATINLDSVLNNSIEDITSDIIFFGSPIGDINSSIEDINSSINVSVSFNGVINSSIENIAGLATDVIFIDNNLRNATLVQRTLYIDQIVPKPLYLSNKL